MDIEHLKEFLVLAEVGNYAAAADSLFISQASLSRHIKGMEEELSLPLFHRSSRRVELSRYGQQLIPYAQQIVNLEGQYTEDLTRTRKAINGSIVVGGLHTMAAYDITKLLALFTVEHPNTEIDLIDEFNAELRECIRSGRCDFVFVRETGSENDGEFDKVSFASDHLVAVLPAGHSLAHAETLQLEQLREETFILLPKQMLMYSITRENCRKAGFEPRLNLSGTTERAIIDMVGHGAFVSLLMKKPAAAMLTPETTIVDVVPTVPSQINVLYRSDRLTIAGKNFLKFIQSWPKDL